MTVTNDDTIKAYDQGVQDYFNQSPQKVTSHIQDWINTALRGLPKTAELFEIGSGTGKDAKYIMSLGYKITLTDASQGFVDFLNHNGYKARIFNILTDDIDKQYDLIFADAVLLHFTADELDGIFRKIAKALKTNGRIAFSVKRGDDEFIEDKKLGKVRYFHLWQPNQLETMLKANGLAITYQHIAEDNRGDKPAWILVVAEKVAQK